jgi:hypothetical protein
LRRWLELAVLFVVLPACFALLARDPAHARFLLPALWTLTLVCLVILLRDVTFDRESLVFMPPRDELGPQLRRMLIRFVPGVIAMAIATVWFAPDALFDLPLHRPLLWLLVAVAYPLLSCVPQGLIWRVFFVHRYSRFFRGPRALIAAGACFFAFAHLAFHNVLALVATAVGGALFMQTYLATRSMWLATMEHAVYGVTAFTLGFGRFLYHGAIGLS